MPFVPCAISDIVMIDYHLWARMNKSILIFNPLTRRNSFGFFEKVIEYRL